MIIGTKNTHVVDRVTVAGTSMRNFGPHEKPLPKLFVDAALPALDGAGIDGRNRCALLNSRLTSDALFYDPVLFETTPHEIICVSARNGSDEGRIAVCAQCHSR